MVAQKLFSGILLILAISIQAEEYFVFPPEKISALLAPYTEKEREEIGKDLQIVKSVCSAKEATSKKYPLYLATAGASGSRKSTILERFLKAYPVYQTDVYLDTDRTLKLMAHTYQAQSLSALMTASSPNYMEVLKAGDEKWRGAANYITLSLLEEALQKKNNVTHGTTSWGDHVQELFKKLKASGYQITLLLCYCEDDLRKEAIEYRNTEQKSYQPVPSDIVAEGRLFVEKMSLYFQYADTLYLYWSDDLLSEEGLAAIFDKGEMIVPEGCFCSYDNFITKLEQDRRVLQGTVPSWEELIQIYRARFKK